MKQIALSTLALLLTAAAFAPVASAQASTPQEISESTSFIEFVRYNRDARDKN